jgi:uncharacterized protein YjbJ (UPF0337 family)
MSAILRPPGRGIWLVNDIKETSVTTATKTKWEGRWEQMVGRAKQLWGKLTNDDLKVAEGDFETLVGRIKARTGLAEEEINKKLCEQCE